MDKKGMFNPWVIIPVLVIVALIAVVLVAKSAAGTIESRIPKTAGCSGDVIKVDLNGYIAVKDVAIIGVTANVQDIVVTSVTDSAGRSLFSFTGGPLWAASNERYEWEVGLWSTATKNRVSVDSGTDIHHGSGEIQRNQFVLTFNVPDNDCNGKIDDFDAVLKAEVLSGTAQTSSTVDKRVLFRSGAFSLG